MSKAYDYFREISANNNDMIMPNDTDVNGDTGRIHDATGVSEGLGGFLANLLMPGFSTALYRPSAQNFIGGLEGDAGGAANYLGAFAKSQGEIDPDTGWNSLGDWLINNGTYWNDRANDVQQQFGTLNRYQNEDILQRLTDTDYLTDSRGLMADVFNGTGSSVPFVVASSLAPEIGIGGALARGAGGLLERLGMSTAGRAVASDLVQSGANDFARYALTGGPLEAAINAGGIYDDLKNQGLSDSEIFGKMNSMVGEELPMDMLTSGLYGAVLGGNTFSRLGQGGWKRAIAANVLNTPADMLGEYMQEMTQQQLQNKYSGKPYGTFWNPTEDEMQAGRAAAMGTLPMGMFGSARGVRNSRRAAMAAADGGSVTGPEPVTPPAVPDPDVDPVEAAQLTGKNDDVPTADGVDVTNLDPQQYTQWYGEKLKSQGIDVPDATITVQTPKATGTTGGAKAGAGANVMDAAKDFMGQHMENGANGCVEAVTKIGARYNPFLADELSKGVVNVDTLVADAGDKVIPFDPNNLEAGDVIVYGDNDHVVLADGNGGYVGNSSSQQKVVQGGDYNNMGGLKPTKIIKTGNGVTAQNTQETTNNGGAPAADLSSLPVGDIATAIAQNTGLPANFIWAQLSHESDGGNSKLAREDHNYGGVKGNDGEYLHFDNDQEFVDYMSNYYPKYREDGIYDAQTADKFAEALQHGGYFTADLGEYEGGMHRYLEQAGLSDSGTAGAPSEKQSGGDNANTMTQQQFGDMLNEKMIDFAGTNDDTVKAVFNDMSTSKDKALVSLFAPYMQDGAFANTAANREALVGNDGFKKAMAMFLSKHLSDYAPTFKNGRISFQQAEDALRPRHQVQAAQTAQAVQATQTPNIQTTASPKMEAAAIQNVLSSFVQGKKNAARTEQEANLFDDMLDADDHFIDTPKNRQTLLKNYGAQLQAYVDDAMTPSLNDRVNQAIEQAVQDKDLNRMNILTQAKQANDTAALEKLVGPQAQQHVDITAMLTPANANVENRVSSKVQETTPSSRPATAERQAPQSEAASTVQGNMSANQAPVRMNNQQTEQQAVPEKQSNVTPLPTQEAQQSEGMRIAQPQPTIDEQNAQMDARIAAIKKQPLAQRKALGQQYLDTLRQNNVPFSEKRLAKPLMDGKPEALEHVQRTYGDLLNTITPAEAAAASQRTEPRTIQAATTARLGNMVSEITSGNTYKNASPVGKLAYLSAASAHAKTVGADKSVKAIDSIIADVRKKAGFSGKGTTEGMTPEQKDEFYNTFYKQSLDDATAIRKEAKDEKPANLKSLDNTIEMFKQELANSKPAKEARKEVTHESTQSKNQQKPDEGAENQDQHAEPEPRKAAEPQPEAEAREVSATKKAADEGGQESKAALKLSAAEEQSLSGTSDEAKQVYTIVRDKLATSKNKGVQRAASASAILLASHADAYAKAYSKATGKKYTALDYMRDKIGIDTDGKVVDDQKARTFFQTAWHGSPHKFDTFSLGAIGTGEGQQIHGWGLYFAGTREVSQERYVKRLSDVIGAKFVWNGNSFKFSQELWDKAKDIDVFDEKTPPLMIALKAVSENMPFGPYTKLSINIKDAANTAREYKKHLQYKIHNSGPVFVPSWFNKFKYRNVRKNIDAALKILENDASVVPIFSGRLFKVEIPDTNVMLDEQLKYNEQPRNIRDGIRAALSEKSSDLLKVWNISLSRRDLRTIMSDNADQVIDDYNNAKSRVFHFRNGEDRPLTFAEYLHLVRHLPEREANHIAEILSRENGNKDLATMYYQIGYSEEDAKRKASNYIQTKEMKDNAERNFREKSEAVEKLLKDSLTPASLSTKTGKQLYDILTVMYGHSQRGASLALLRHGVKGITYAGGMDGRCYVVFDDKAIDVINKYDQMANGAVQGYTSVLSDGKRLVSLLDSADESTFLHEMGHVFLLDLQDLAEVDQTAANDMAAVEGWTTWKKGQAKEYKGTAWEQEFADREQAIVKAMADGDEATVNQLKDEWAQERFARGLERYLESGEAPSSKLKAVFEKFKQFLTRIYEAFKGEGGKPSEDVKNVMARMMDSDVKNTIKVPPMGKPIIGRTGNETTVTTDSGKTLRVRYRLVPTDRVITSHSAETMTPNKAYPQELQPRDRQRVSMQEQVTAMANELRPADLGAGRNLNQGAPIIRKDGVVLNGNGRAMAIQKARAMKGKSATAYNKYLVQHAQEFGFTQDVVKGLNKPMLVREVVDDIDADTMQDIIGSTAGGSRMGASEQAKADAKKIKPRDLDSYVDNEQGDLTTAANQNFVANILYRIVGKNERNAYTDERGNVNADGIQRVKRALFSLAYDDDGLIGKMAESTDDNIRNVSRGLMSAAPAFARVNLSVKDGQAYEYDAGKTISDAVKHLDALRREGKPVKDYLNEQSMFSEYQDTDEVREVLRFFDENKRSGKRIGIFLNDMARSILEQGSPNQTSLMDGGRATLGEIIKSAERVARNGTTAASLFGNKEESHIDVARSKASVQGDLKKIGKRVVFLPDNSLTSREKGIKEFGEKMGLKVVFFEGPSNLHGMYENGVSFINRSSSTSAPWTFWHETFHWLRHNNPELYRQMVSAIGKKQAFSSEQLQAYRDKTGRQALSDADVIEEMLADAMPDVHKRVSLFRDLGKADASLLQRFVGWLRDAMRAFHDALTGRKAGLSETQKAAMRDALANIAADLRDSNGKRIFKVNGAEREITAADGTKLSYPARFSGKQEAPTTFTAEDRLKADSKAWKGTLREAWKGDMPDTTMLPVMQTPLVLQMLGVHDYPMVMMQKKLMKIKKDHPEMTKAVLNKLPEHLADPMIIFKSTTVPGRLVVGLDLKDTAGINVVVPIELNAKDGRLDVNVLTSAYGRGENGHTNVQYSWFWKNINEGNAIYVNKKQAADFYQSAGLQLPMEGRRFNDLFGSSIKTDADLVKSRRENPVRYSLDANDNSTPSLLTRAYNHLTGRKDAASHDKNVKAMLEDITKMRIRFGKLDPKTETVFKKFEGVIRARNANEWEKVLPEAGRAIADRLNLKPSEDMNNYIAKWLLDEATNDTSQEASDFATALKNDTVLSDQLIDLKTLFNERNNREADEVVRDAIQYEKPKERTTLTKAWETFYDEMIEELGPVKRMVKRVQEKSGQELATSVNPYIALRLFRGNAGRAMTMIEGQSEAAVKALQTNYPGVNFNGFKTLHMILDECGALHNEKRMKDFLAFALACHVKDIHTLNNRIRKSQQRLRDKIADLNDKINNLPEYQQLIESDKKVDDKYQEQREAYQKEIEGYQAKIDKAEKTIMEVPRTEDGLSLTEERCDEVIKKFRDEYGDAQQDLVRFSKVTTAILYDAGVISKKRYKELQDSWPNYIPMFRVFEDNEDVDFGDSLKHMHGSTRRIINPLDSIIRNTYDFVKKAEKNKARQLLANLTRISDVGEYIEEVDNSKPNDKTTITFYEDGKRKYLQTDPDIVKAVNNMGRAETNLVLRLLHAPAKIARACFTTINPSFALRNIIRDATDASIYSKYGFKPWDFVRGFLHAVHQDELFYEWLSSGAAQASAISLDRDYTQATLNQMTKTWKERLLSKKFLPAILEGMQMVSEYSEYGTRIAAYERAKKKLAGENGPHPAAYDLASAALESRDLMDFARGGRGSRYLNNVVVFANASIQGFDKFFRTFDFRKPYRKESMKALARLFLCGMLPALLLAGIHSGDDWWEELPDWQKETNWILGKVGNTIIRIPKGQDIGLRFFSNLIEKAMDRSKHKVGDYFKPVWDSLPDMIPTALLPIIEATANHSYFTGAPVVPKYQEKLPAYLQFGNETSSFAKFVGKVIGVSPRKVEHVLFGYTGNMGKGLLGVYDTIVGNQSLNTNLNEAPVISGFTAIPYKQSKTVNDFYDKFDEQQRLNEEFKLTKKKPDGYDPALYERMTKAQQELSKINKQERAAIDDPKMDSGIREQKQLGYQQQRLSVVRRVMGQ